MRILESKVVFIGAGNMAEAIASGLIEQGFCAPEKIVMTDIRAERLAGLAEEYGVTTETNNIAAVDGAEIIVLAVKPQVMEAVLAELKFAIDPGALVISIAAGIWTGKIEAALAEKQRVVRVMPNMPALIGQGAAAIASGKYAEKPDLEVAEKMFEAVGLAVQVKESVMDAVTALSGSGPAYVFYLIEAMLAAAEKMELKADAARILALQTVEGAVRLLKDGGEEAAALRAKVTSKGGTTEAAIRIFDEAGVRDAITNAILAARDRSVELSGNG